MDEDRDDDVWMNGKWVTQQHFRRFSRRAPVLSRKRTRRPYHGESRRAHRDRVARQFGDRTAAMD